MCVRGDWGAVQKIERNFAGSSPSGFSQARWAAGATDDRENDGDDLELEVDDEPNLCPKTMD
jgi:hypothetical protein